MKTAIVGHNPLTGEEVNSFGLYVEVSDGTYVLLSHPTYYLFKKGKNSESTANNYAENLKRYFNWLLQSKDYQQYFWANATNSTLVRWQVDRVAKRNIEKKNYPKDETISRDAILVAQFYQWMNDRHFSTGVLINKKQSHLANFKSDDFVKRVTDRIAEISDYTDIRIKSISSTKNTKYKVVLQLSDLRSLLAAIADPVYLCIFLTGLASGMRKNEILQIPYVGTSANAHFKAYATTESDEPLSIHLIGKGNKSRVVRISPKDWEIVMAKYLPLFNKRRQLYKKKHGEELPPDILWLKKNGEPVDKASIGNAMSYAAKKSGVDGSLHDARHWYATKFIIEALGDKLNDRVRYRAEIDEALRRQLGHNRIRTTYETYVNTARFYWNIDKGFFNEIYGEHGFLAEAV
jgi:site-specific recombinase XerD